MVRKYSGWALGVAVSALALACATDGQGPVDVSGDPERPGSGSEGPPNYSEQPPNYTEASCSSQATASDLLGAFGLFCRHFEECGWFEEEPPIEEQNYVISGKPTALDGYNRLVSYLPAQRTLDSHEESTGVCEFVEACAADTSCLASVSAEPLPFCISDYVACLRAIVSLVPCNGDLSSLEDVAIPAACARISVDDEEEYEPPEDENPE